jgi:hypothetical protein
MPHAPIEFRHLLSIAFVLSLSSCGYERFLADREIDRLCKIDGGVRVIEHDDPPKEFLRPDRTISLQAIERAKSQQSYFLERNVSYVKSDKPQIVRIEESLFRGLDRKVLGVAVAYMRPNDHSYELSPFPTSKSCPENGATLPLVSAVFRAKATNF